MGAHHPSLGNCRGCLLQEPTPTGVVYSEKRVNLNSTAQRGVAAEVPDPTSAATATDFMVPLDLSPTPTPAITCSPNRTPRPEPRILSSLLAPDLTMLRHHRGT